MTNFTNLEIVRTYTTVHGVVGAVYVLDGNRCASFIGKVAVEQVEEILRERFGIKAEKAVEDVLVELGGSLWEKHGHRRIYLSEEALARLIGFEVTRRNGRGRITGARFQGNAISNNYAEEIARSLSGKFWYDLDAKSFGHKDMSTEIADEIDWALTDHI